MLTNSPIASRPRKKGYVPRPPAPPRGIGGSRPPRPTPGIPGDRGPRYPGPVTTPGYNPDYDALIQADAGYMGWKAQAQNQLSHSALDRAAALRQLVLRHGGLPAGAQDAFGDIRAEDISAGAGNAFSDSALLRRNYDMGIRDMRRSLAARGALQSGELGYGQDQAEFERAGAESQLNSEFLGRLREAVGGYTGVVDELGAQEVGVIDQARQRAQEAYKPTPEGKAKFLVGSRRKYGLHLWQDKAGQVWRKDPVTHLPVKWTGTL